MIFIYEGYEQYAEINDWYQEQNEIKHMQRCKSLHRYQYLGSSSTEVTNK